MLDELGSEYKGFTTLPDNYEENPTVVMKPIRIAENTDTTEFHPEIMALLGASTLQELVRTIKEKADRKMMIAQDAKEQVTIVPMSYEELLKKIREAVQKLSRLPLNYKEAIAAIPTFAFEDETKNASFPTHVVELISKAKQTPEGKEFIQNFMKE